MRNIRRRPRGYRACGVSGFCVVLFLLGSIAQASTVNVGALSYDTFIPAGNGSPGVFAFNLANLTSAFSLPPDFPVTDSLTFGSATLTLTLSNLSQDVIDLGDIAPGFLLDGNGNPIVQVPGDEVFDSAEFTATLSPLTFALYDGTEFTAASSSIDILLLPSMGSTLTVDVDNTTISLTGTVPTATPEPASGVLVVAGLFGLAWRIRRRGCSWAILVERI
jgi:MYXO-CTERM domain-containing protein